MAKWTGVNTDEAGTFDDLNGFPAGSIIIPANQHVLFEIFIEVPQSDGGDGLKGGYDSTPIT